MQINKLAYVLLPIIALSSPSEVSDWGEIDNDNNGIIVGRGESTTNPGGFSSVAEPAGPVDPEAAKRAAEKYHLHCVAIPTLAALLDKTEVITPDPGTPYPNYTVSHAYEVTGNGYVIRLRTSWSARWRIAGQAQWHQVNGTVTTTETSSPFNLYIADSYGTTP